jgi:hypothetical protein
MSRTVTSLCVAGLTSLALITPTAAHADDHTGAQSEANAITATILGETADSGTVRATNDGSGEQKTGPVNPLPTVLPDQPYAGIGVLAQDAVADNDGNSAACAGIAGDGGSANVIEIGDSDCIEPGDNIDLALVDLDLSVLLEGEVIDGSDATLADLLTTLTAGESDTLVAALQSAVDDLEANLGNAGLALDAGAIESSCTYDGQAEGTTFLTRAGISLLIPEHGREQVLTFDPEPDPNTRVVTELDEVIALILEDLRDGMNDNLDTLTDAVYDSLLTPVVQEQIVEAAIAQLQPALAEVEGNLLELILNKQTRDGDSIAVTGLSASLLPGAAQFDAPEILELDIANVGCGPFRAAGGPTDSEGNPVPTVVNAGEGSTPWVQSGLLGGLALLVAGGTAFGLRRARS